MAFYSTEEQDNPPGTEASVHTPQASEEPVIFQSRVTSGPYHIPTWLHYADGAITELKQVIETVEDFLSVHPELDLNVKDQIFKTAAWTHDLLVSSPYYDPEINSHEHIQAIQVSVHKAVDNPLYIPKYTEIAQYLHALEPYNPQFRELESLRHFPNRKCAIDRFLDKLHATKAEQQCCHESCPHCLSTSLQCTCSSSSPYVPLRSAFISLISDRHRANLLQGASVKMDIDDQGTPSQMGRPFDHNDQVSETSPSSFQNQMSTFLYDKAQLRNPMFNNFLQAIDVPSVANFEGQPPSAILAVSNYHTIEYLDQLSKARLHANCAEQSRHIAKRAFAALAAKHADDIRTPATDEECIFMARYREVHRLNTENQAAAELAAAASSSAGLSGTSEAHAIHPAPTPAEVPVQTFTVMVGTIPITVTAPSVVPEGPEEDMQSTFSA
ncbi:hypothetical protein BT96DRAFT_991510 [Gymnopus androsaceus JB14]|uniref:Uncharacterized protein n=1 Tax=Gymnopus androsaceus JB14 TaxID=1447944 RepID=A0A6A4HUX4_9AGAR|nr:hypothetical protein BT96DRAFT_991510 [Gymnopus androsaceus JB14]